MDRESQMCLDGLWLPSAQARDCAARLQGWLLGVARHEAGRRSSSVLLAGFGIDQVAQPMPLALRGPAGPVDPAMPDFLHKANQFGEIAHAGGLGGR